MQALSIRQLTKTYPNGQQALTGIDFSVEEGDFFALLGPNGAGKSTTIGIITSLVNKTSGQVTVFDTNIDDDFSRAKSYIGLVPQEFNCSIFEKCIDVLINQAGFYGVPYRIAKERAEFFLHKLDLWDKRNIIVRQLSGGMKRRLIIARALVHQPRLLILDEPTAGVDIEIRRMIWDFMREINQAGTTIILTTHYLEEAENLCRNIAIIDQGHLVENTSMRQLLDKLHIETFVLYLAQSISSPPKITNFNLRLIDDMTLEVDVAKEQPMNALFHELSTQSIKILSMRNKNNRLEELFLEMIHQPEESKEVLAAKQIESDEHA
ncbi:MAG: ATP-binding cassette domain-containing protein [Legionellales bacterium]|nr:ATP-binding cassette domain-containing protein [Legionellales bacterium]